MKLEALISLAITMQHICNLAFAYGTSKFSHDVAMIFLAVELLNLAYAHMNQHSTVFTNIHVHVDYYNLYIRHIVRKPALCIMQKIKVQMSCEHYCAG